MKYIISREAVWISAKNIVEKLSSEKKYKTTHESWAEDVSSGRMTYESWAENILRNIEFSGNREFELDTNEMRCFRYGADDCFLDDD